jgi:hypothetical protein
MRNGFIRELHVAIGQTSLSVHMVRGWKEAVPACVAALPLAGRSAQQIAATLEQALDDARHGGAHVRIAVADAYTRLFMVQPPRNASGMRDMRAAAAMRFKSLYEMPADAWRIEADWNAEMPFLACGMPKDLLAGLEPVLAKRRLKLLEIAPNFVVAWNRWHARLKEGAWFGVVHESMLTLAPSANASISALRPLPVPATGWKNDDWLIEHMQREALRLSLPALGQLQICGDLPAGWTDRIVTGIALQRLQAPSKTPQAALLKLAQEGA